jgi:hypothetical protein
LSHISSPSLFFHIGLCSNFAWASLQLSSPSRVAGATGMQHYGQAILIQLKVSFVFSFLLQWEFSSRPELFRMLILAFEPPHSKLLT